MDDLYELKDHDLIKHIYSILSRLFKIWKYFKKEEIEEKVSLFKKKS